MTRSTPAYERAPSKELMALLSPGGFLAPLVGLTTRRVAGLPLDVHLRPKDVVHIYSGLTSVLRVKRNGDGTVMVSADDYYRDQACAHTLIGSWNTEEPRDFTEALDAYLGGVTAQSQHTQGEGRVQSSWARAREPWTPFDKEVRLRYPSKEERRRLTEFDHVNAARTELVSRGESPPKGGLKVDQLAVDPEGRLVVIELKDASATSDKVCYAPLQLLHYVWQWHCALKHVRDDVQQLIDARVALGMTPESIPRLSGGIRPVVGFGPDHRSKEMKRRYCDVLEVVNRHLPPGVPGIETWSFDKEAVRPQRVDC